MGVGQEFYDVRPMIPGAAMTTPIRNQGKLFLEQFKVCQSRDGCCGAVKVFGNNHCCSSL